MGRITDDSRGLRDRYPIFFAFGDVIPFLSPEECVAATVHDRIKSVWPFLVKTVVRFVDTLSARSRASFDPEDVLMELWVRLAEKDYKFDPERGSYLTFVGRVTENELKKLRGRTKTVRSPGNTYSRLREYQDEEDNGTLTPQRRATMRAMQRSLADADSIDGGEAIHARSGLGPEARSLRDEEERIASDAIVRAVTCLDPDEAVAVGRNYGLFGQDEATPTATARGRGKGRTLMIDALERAQHKMLAALEDHPITDQFA